VKQWIHLRFQDHSHGRLRYPVGDGRDGDFILPLLRSRVGIFLLVVLCWWNGGVSWCRVALTFVIRFGCGVWCVGLRG
jgi:hypothetical protein